MVFLLLKSAAENQTAKKTDDLRSVCYLVNLNLKREPNLKFPIEGEEYFSFES